MKTNPLRKLWPDLSHVSRRNSAVQAAWQEQLGSAWSRLSKLLVVVPVLALGYVAWVAGDAYSEGLLSVMKAMGEALAAVGGLLLEYRIPYVTSVVAAVLMANVEIRSTLALYALTLQNDLKDFSKQDLNDIFDASYPVQGFWLGSIVVQSLLIFAVGQLPQSFFALSFTGACYVCSALVARYALPPAVKDKGNSEHGLKFSLYQTAMGRLAKQSAEEKERAAKDSPERVRPEYVY